MSSSEDNKDWDFSDSESDHQHRHSDDGDADQGYSNDNYQKKDGHKKEYVQRDRPPAPSNPQQDKKKSALEELVDEYETDTYDNRRRGGGRGGDRDRRGGGYGRGSRGYGGGGGRPPRDRELTSYTSIL